MLAHRTCSYRYRWAFAYGGGWDNSSRQNLFLATNDDGGGDPDDEMATPQRLLFGEKDVKISPARKRPGTIDDYLKDDDDYEWKSICWIDSKVRVKTDLPITIDVLRERLANILATEPHTYSSYVKQGLIRRCRNTHEQRSSTGGNVRPSIRSRSGPVLVRACPVVSIGRRAWRRHDRWRRSAGCIPFADGRLARPGRENRYNGMTRPPDNWL